MPLKAGEQSGSFEILSTTMAWIVAAIFVLVSAALAIALLLPGKVSEPAKIRFIVETPSAPKPFVFSLSPDGKHLVEVVTQKSGFMLWVRALENLNGQLLPGTEIGPETEFPFWSPDGRAVAFFADGKLKKADIFAGPVQTCVTQQMSMEGHLCGITRFQGAQAARHISIQGPFCATWIPLVHPR